jgi:hypothetical protein
VVEQLLCNEKVESSILSSGTIEKLLENKDRKLAVSNKVTAFISGKLSWAKVLGEPVVNYNKDGREWTFELEPDENGLQLLIKNGLTDRIKGMGYNIGTKAQHKERNPFIQLKKTEFNKDGNSNPPIRIYDVDDNEWDAKPNDKGIPTNLIGNGSEGDIKLDIRDYGPGKKKGIYPVAIRVTSQVEYEASEFGAMDSGHAKTPAVDTFKRDFGLDDEIPV